MAQIRKYANLNLPDLDNAPDVYETPELTEDASTLQDSTVRSPSPSQDGNASDDNSAVDRRRFNPTSARSHFRPARVDANNVDFSDRISHHKTSYRTSHRRRRGSNGQYGDLSDDEEEESKDRKLARLRREVAELKDQFDEEQMQKQEQSKNAELPESDPHADINRLAALLDKSYIERHNLSQGASEHFTATLQKYATYHHHPSTQHTSTPTRIPLRAPPAAPPQQQEYLLAQAADFDTRLAALEATLGLNSITMPDLGTNPPVFSVIQSLEQLDSQLSTIASTTPSTLDAHSRKVRELISDAEKLDAIRKTNELSAAASAASAGKSTAAGAGAGAGRRGSVADEEDKAEDEDPERVAKINALYGALDTIDRVSPTLPLVLERLRSLRLIHASAMTAGATLDAVEKRQVEQEAEIKGWRATLDKIEGRLGEGEKVTEGNIKTVEGWVGDIEKRIAKFS
ncbi:hypothetical protein EJ05DRAFT_512238 [Pseudovirgaria hyperparasitica]|uniref:Dynactin subunit n=1 Tax=Pseudovirgaria hyperparasitica TaxID=470096 RepID=A0A6A6W3R0_9PEZI|nr:uncharacterized protein EJ05DRAFT_512238 [Pseudovirgaria hyperparasitica]KAF2756606.1 hypothetical protein EJ05DRAFT_512238 [Pseudovirgaria hyperparasitica]